MTLQRKTAPLALFGGPGRVRGELRYRDLAEQLVDALFIAAPRSGLFLYVNHKAIELAGYSRDEFSGLSLSELFSPREAEDALEIIRHLEIGATRHVQSVPLRTHDGKLVFTDLRLTATGDEGETLVMILARDAEQRLISEQSAGRRRESLAALEDLLALLLSAERETLETVLAACYRLVQANFVAFYQRAAEPAGAQLRRAINAPAELPESIPAADAALAAAPLVWRVGERPTSALCRAARAAGLAVLYANPVGVERGVEAGLLVVGYRFGDLSLQAHESDALVGIAARFLTAYQSSRRRDETLSKSEKQLALVECGLQAVLDESNEGILRIDAAGRVLELNAAAESLLGFRATDTINAPLEDVLISAQVLAAPIVFALRQGFRWGGVETELIRRDGGSVAVSLHAVPLADEKNQPDGGLVLIADRTDQKQFQAQSDHLERRAWLGDLSAIFAHDVRNPLNGIAAGLSYLATKFAVDDPLSQAVSKMQGEVTRIEQLLKNVLLVAKSTEVNYQPVPLSQLVERIMARWAPRLARYNIQLSYYADPATPPAMADQRQMDQVITNLIVNAVDAMSARGGTLSIKCHPAAHARAPRGEFVELIFGDTGPGIQPDMQDRIFDPFITTKADGTGLGLAITKRIVTAHKGTVFVESWPGIGTAFHVFIPVAKW